MISVIDFWISVTIDHLFFTTNQRNIVHRCSNDHLALFKIFTNVCMWIVYISQRNIVHRCFNLHLPLFNLDFYKRMYVCIHRLYFSSQITRKLDNEQLCETQISDFSNVEAQLTLPWKPNGCCLHVQCQTPSSESSEPWCPGKEKFRKISKLWSCRDVI